MWPSEERIVLLTTYLYRSKSLRIASTGFESLPEDVKTKILMKLEYTLTLNYNQTDRSKWQKLFVNICKGNKGKAIDLRNRDVFRVQACTNGIFKVSKELGNLACEVTRSLLKGPVGSVPRFLLGNKYTFGGDELFEKVAKDDMSKVLLQVWQRLPVVLVGTG